MCQRQKGNIMLVIAVVILMLSIILASCMHMVKLYLEEAVLVRYTSNTYYLAKSAIETQVAQMNKALEVELSHIVTDISKEYVTQLAEPKTDGEKLMAMEARLSSTKYKNFYYAQDQIRILDSVLEATFQEKIYTFITNTYLNQSISYNVMTDVIQDYQTNITINFEPLYKKDGKTIDETGLKIIAKAVTKGSKASDIYDTQVVEAIVDFNIPDKLPHQFHEDYVWTACPPEILDKALICFSDAVVTDGSSLTIEQGDLVVKGSVTPASSQVHSMEEDMRSCGGIIVSNGGKLLMHQGDVVCVQNVMATNSLEKSSENTVIKVAEGDIIAHTTGIIGDLTEKNANTIKNVTIQVDQNIFASNDVAIGDGVNDSKIDIGGTIFGVNNGSGLGESPYISSGVFVKGDGNNINMYRFLLNGQAYTHLDHQSVPMKLWESVGEPFDRVALWEGYKIGEDTEKNSSYLDEAGPFTSLIKKESIEVRDGDIENNCFAPARVSANGRITKALGIGLGITDPILAGDILMRGFTKKYVVPMALYTNHHGDYKDVAYIIEQTRQSASYYKTSQASTYSWYTQQQMYGKNYTTDKVALKDYMGIKAYLTAKRSIFYGKLDAHGIPQLLNFHEVLGTVPKEEIQWQYHNPIVIHSKDTDYKVKLKDFYVDEGGKQPYPTLLINAGTGELILEAEKGYENFKGIIISQGDVRIKGNVNIEGTLIIGGSHENKSPSQYKTRILGETKGGYSPGLLIKGEENHLTIKHNGNILLQLQIEDLVMYRQILDALKITQYAGHDDLKQILGPYKDDQLSYTAGKVFYSNTSTLDIKTQDIKMVTKQLRKVAS